ncbi:hypothetical protein PV325_003937, partial [Microctonus aethiopoides]
MNLMFRKNFGGDKAPSGETRSGICGGVGYASTSASGLGSNTSSSLVGGGGRLGIRPSIVNAGGGRVPIRRSREFGYYPMDDHPTHAYRTHLFLSPNSGAAANDESGGERIGPGPRRNSGPHIIKWGGTGNINNNINNNSNSNSNNNNNNNNSNNNNNAITVLGPNKRKQSANQQNAKEISEPPTPTASKQ